MTQAVIHNHCPHCWVGNDPGHRYCEACGKAMPLAQRREPRVVGRSLARTRPGRELQLPELKRQAKVARVVLLLLTVLSGLLGVFCLVLMTNPAGRLGPDEVSTYAAAAAAMGVQTLLYLGLWWWAERSPLPASIAGLILFLTFAAVAALADPVAVLGGGWTLLVAFTAIFCKAISDGVKHRQLEVQGDADGA